MCRPIHWTYEEYDEESDLYQGDIILPSTEMRKILQKPHPHFTQNKYTGFLVLTQTCDLVRRAHKPPATKYVNIAVIRPLEDMLNKFIDNIGMALSIKKNLISGIYSSNNKFKAKQLIERIVNQNEQKGGIFYLYPHESAGIAVHSVALLQVSVALKAEHYDTLVKNRCGRLTPEFRSRLGWLAGNMFSRVAVREWEKRRAEEITKEILNLGSGGENPIEWIPEAKFKTAPKNIIISNESDMSHSNIMKKINELEVKSPITKACSHVENAITGVLMNLDDEDLDKILRRLKNNPDFSSLLK